MYLYFPLVDVYVTTEKTTQQHSTINAGNERCCSIILKEQKKKQEYTFVYFAYFPQLHNSFSVV